METNLAGGNHGAGRGRDGPGREDAARKPAHRLALTGKQPRRLRPAATPGRARHHPPRPRRHPHPQPGRRRRRGRRGEAGGGGGHVRAAATSEGGCAAAKRERERESWCVCAPRRDLTILSTYLPSSSRVASRLPDGLGLHGRRAHVIPRGEKVH